MSRKLILAIDSVELQPILLETNHIKLLFSLRQAIQNYLLDSHIHLQLVFKGDILNNKGEKS